MQDFVNKDITIYAEIVVAVGTSISRTRDGIDGFGFLR